MSREKMEVAMAIAAPNQLHYHHHPNLQQHQSQPLQHTQQPNFRSQRRKSLSLENYLAFLRSRDHRNLTVEHLRQIISIHGFKKVKQQRKDFEEAIEAIELIEPTRSTLNDLTSPEAFITLEEAIKDLGTLNWQECSVNSIRSISALNDAPVPPESAIKRTTQKAKKRSKSMPPATSLSSGNVGSGPNESGSGNSSLSSSGDNDGSLRKSGSAGGSLSLGVAEGKDGAEMKRRGRKRKGIERVLAGTVAVTDTVNSI